MYQETTRGITIEVEPIYLEDQSQPEACQYFWAYRVKIQNQSGQTVQLRTRHWKITDALGRLQEVKGDGVVGEQPVLEPGQSFEYTSGTPLSTPSGFMVGSYGMETKDGERFDAHVPAFSLDSPGDRRSLN